MVEVSAENITLVTVITFLSMFFILVASMPPGIISTPQQGKVINVPEYFEAIDLSYFAVTKNFTVGPNLWNYAFQVGGWNVKATYYDIFDSIVMWTYDSFGIFEYNIEDFKWYDSQGVKVSDRINTLGALGGWREAISLTTICNAFTNNTSAFTIQNSKTQCKIYFGYDSTKYKSPREAFQDGNLGVLVGMGIDNTNTRINAWNFIGMLLFFQAPDVHPLLNAIIAIPIWIMIAWLIYILILKAIPFVGG
jgi:hypothetical protein